MLKKIIVLTMALMMISTAVFAAKVKIGFSIDDLRVERWQKDRDFFLAAAKEMDATVYVQAADANEQKQIAQIENLISRGVDVLVIVPFNGEVLSNVIADAKSSGIKVIAYDRLIKNADIDAYISFDNYRVGVMQAEEIVKRAPKGNYMYIGGSPTDNNAFMFRDGAMSVIQPLVDKGDIKLVTNQLTRDWMPSLALKTVEDSLTKNNNDIQAIVAANDGLGGAAVQALGSQGLAGKVPVSGQDADTAAIKRISEGTQTMTIYKPLNQIATEAAKLAVMLGEGKTLKEGMMGDINVGMIDNGKKDVPFVKLTPVAVTKENIDIVFDDGHLKREDVFK